VIHRSDIRNTVRAEPIKARLGEPRRGEETA
jgi:hypothetical protein